MACDEWLPHDVGHTISPLLVHYTNKQGPRRGGNDEGEGGGGASSGSSRTREDGMDFLANFFCAPAEAEAGVAKRERFGGAEEGEILRQMLRRLVLATNVGAVDDVPGVDDAATTDDKNATTSREGKKNTKKRKKKQQQKQQRERKGLGEEEEVDEEGGGRRRWRRRQRR